MNKLLCILFFSFSFFLSIKTSISNTFFILITITILIDFIFISKPRKLNYKELIYSTAPLFIISIVGLTWSLNFKNGLHILGKQATLFLIPFVFLLIYEKQKEQIVKYSLLGLVFGSVLTSVVLLTNTTFKIVTSIEDITISKIFSSFYTSHRYTDIITSIDPSYLGIYSLTALAVVTLEKLSFSKKIKVLFSIILMISLLFINSRIIFLGLILLLILKIVLIKRIKNRIIVSVIISFSIAISLFTLKDSYVYKKAFVGSFWELGNNIGTSNTSDSIKSDSRLARWNCAIEKGKKNLFLGSGIGSELDVLIPCYKENNMIIAYEKNFNTHNQFLSYFVTLGIIGVLIFFFFFYINFFKAIQNKNILALFFFISIFLMCLIENIFARNAGIIFFAMYTSLFNLKIKSA